MAANQDIVQRILKSVGFSDADARTLSSRLIEQNVAGEVDFERPDSVQRAIRDTDAYKTRFAGNVALRDAGRPEKSFAEYLDMEDSYRNVLVSNGMPATFYDTPSDFAKFIGGNISAAEVNQRVQSGYRAVKDTDPQVVAEFQRLYGVDESALAAYFIDPTKTLPILERQAQAARIAGAAQTQAKMGISAAQAEGLAAQGITPEDSQKIFGTIGKEKELYSALQGETAITVEEQIAGVSGTSAEAAQRIAQRKRARAAQFEAGGGFVQTQQGTTGLKTVGQ